MEPAGVAGRAAQAVSEYGWRAGGRWVAPAVSVAALVVYVATLAPGLTTAHAGVDGGDLVTAAQTLGVPHPTGYPTYTLLARLATHLPLGTPAYRANLLSAVCTALAAGLVCATAGHLLDGTTRAHLIAAAAGLSLAFASLPWSQAVIAEVYALLLLCAALLVWLVVRWRQDKGRSHRHRLLWTAALVLGLGLGNHLTLLFLVPGLLVLLWPERSSWGRPRVLLPAAGLFLAGLAVYTYLPLAAAGQPPVAWGDPRTWDRFLWVVTGQPYRPYVLALPLAAVPGRLGAWAGLLGDQLGWWGLGLAAIGAWACWQPARRPLALAALVWVLPAAMYAFFYATDDAYVLLLPLMVPMALAWAVGVGTLERWNVGTFKRWLVIAVALVLPVLSLAMHWSAADLSRNREAEAYVGQALGGAAPGALIMTQGDRATFWLWHGLYAEERRPDVAVVNAPLLAYDWYREQVRRLSPDLVVPEPENPDAPLDDLVRELMGQALDQRPVYAADPPAAWGEWFRLEEDEGGTGLMVVQAR